MNRGRTVERDPACLRLARWFLVSALLLSGCASDPVGRRSPASVPANASASAQSAITLANGGHSWPPQETPAPDAATGTADAMPARDPGAVDCYYGTIRELVFREGSAALEPCVIKLLDEDIVIMKRYPDLRAEVSGHTDIADGAGDHMQLSRERARVVRDYLIDHGIDASQLDGPVGYGESRPIAPSKQIDGTPYPEGAARNRRAEVSVLN